MIRVFVGSLLNFSNTCLELDPCLRTVEKLWHMSYVRVFFVSGWDVHALCLSEPSGDDYVVQVMIYLGAEWFLWNVVIPAFGAGSAGLRCARYVRALIVVSYI